GVYSGMVVLRDSVHRINKPATFTIDMTDSTWSVRSVRFLAAKAELYDRSTDGKSREALLSRAI
ncbi:hypothetical protein RNH98_29955, partial [Pseudomonas aeruginosa]|uniref:hypothetical protein n=1 Tax=Pseudomonas aeruginosa TaxID=287 RepID=UPI002887D589